MECPIGRDREIMLGRFNTWVLGIFSVQIDISNFVSGPSLEIVYKLGEGHGEGRNIPWIMKIWHIFCITIILYEDQLAKRQKAKKNQLKCNPRKNPHNWESSDDGCTDFFILLPKVSVENMENIEFSLEIFFCCV